MERTACTKTQKIIVVCSPAIDSSRSVALSFQQWLTEASSHINGLLELTVVVLQPGFFSSNIYGCRFTVEYADFEAIDNVACIFALLYPGRKSNANWQVRMRLIAAWITVVIDSALIGSEHRVELLCRCIAAGRITAVAHVEKRLGRVTTLDRQDIPTIIHVVSDYPVFGHDTTHLY